MRWLTLLRAIAALLSISLVAMSSPAAAEEVLVFAAASLKNALDDAVATYRARSADQVKVSYAASSALAKQIESGAPADIFISADLDWMEYLEQHHLIQPQTRRNLLSNHLVLIAPAGSRFAVSIAPGLLLAKMLGDGRLSVADPDSVPAGKYAKAALEKLGLWSSVENKLARTENVRAALFFVSRREAPLGIVYATDAAADKGVKVVATFPDDSHPPIVYPIALTASGKSEAAAALLRFLESPDARASFEGQGFTVLE